MPAKVRWEKDKIDERNAVDARRRREEMDQLLAKADMLGCRDKAQAFIETGQAYRVKEYLDEVAAAANKGG